MLGALGVGCGETGRLLSETLTGTVAAPDTGGMPSRPGQPSGPHREVLSSLLLCFIHVSFLGLCSGVLPFPTQCPASRPVLGQLEALEGALLPRAGPAGAWPWGGGGWRHSDE